MRLFSIMLIGFRARPFRGSQLRFQTPQLFLYLSSGAVVYSFAALISAYRMYGRTYVGTYVHAYGRTYGRGLAPFTQLFAAPGSHYNRYDQGMESP